MTTIRQQRVRRAGSIALAALLLVPLLASGHHHAVHRAAPCATCVVTQHTPVVSGPVVPVPASSLVVLPLEYVAATAPAGAAARRTANRGPPAPFLAQGT